MLEILLAAILGLGADVITVDDDGPADFTTIVDAVAAALPGDIVLVSAGSYAGFVLDKDLTLFGPASGHRPLVISSAQVLAVNRFTLAGFDLRSLEVEGVTEQGVIDDCSVGSILDDPVSSGLQIVNCAEVLVSRSVIEGYDSKSTQQSGGPALEVTDSQVAVVECEITGGRGADGGIGSSGTSGGNAMSLMGQESRAFIVASTLVGGNGGYAGVFTAAGNGGDGLYIDHAKAVLRAAGDQEVAGGIALDPLQGGDDGASISMEGSTAVLVVSDVVYDPASVDIGLNAKLKIPPTPEPFLQTAQMFAPEPSTHVLLHGPQDQPALLLASLQPDAVTVDKLELPVWLAMNGMVVIPVVTAGLDQPLDFLFHVPDDPNLLGSIVLVQAVFPDMTSTLESGKIVVTNPIALVVRF